MLLTALLPLASLLSTSLAATICNGQSALCSRSYSSVTFVGAHNSYAVGRNVADNQNKDVTAQLNDGIRTLQVQAHSASDGIHLCHGSCALRDGGLLSTYLGTVASWVQSNPNEVISMVIVNSDNLPASQYASAFQSSGLASYAFVPSSPTMTLSAWPSLGSMIDSGKRVVVFMDNGADSSVAPYILDEFSNMWEDAYNAVDQSFGCAVNRSRASPSETLFMINHYLDVTYNFAGTQIFTPDLTKLNVTNSGNGYGSISAHVSNCMSIWGRNPNHILLDYYDSNGSTPFQIAAQLNGVSAPTNVVASASPTSTGTGRTTGTGSSGTVAVTQVKIGGAGARAGIMGMSGSKGTAGVALGLVGVVLGAAMV